MSGAGLEAVGVADLDVPEPRCGLEQRRGDVDLLDVHVVGVGGYAHRRQADRLTEGHRLAESVDHVVFVPVQRFQRDDHPYASRVLGELAEPVDQDLVVGPRGARRFEGRQPPAEHSVRRRRHRQPTTQLRDRGQLSDGAEPGRHGDDRHRSRRESAACRRTRSASERSGGRAAQLGKPGRKGAVSSAAKPIAVEAIRLSGFPLLLQ